MMNLNISDYFATVALVVSVVSAYYAKKQHDLSAAALRIEYRSHLSVHHDKYRTALKQINDTHEDSIMRLSEQAGRTLCSAVDIFDRYDLHPHECRYLRHLVHECSEIAYYALKGQFGWQSGANITHRFFQLTQLEDRLDPRSGRLSQDSARAYFQRRNVSNPNKWQEIDLLHDAYFCKLVEQIKTRVDPARSAELLLEIQETCRAFGTKLEQMTPGISESAAYLTKTLEESDLEHFPLSESPKLYDYVTYKRATLDTLSRLRIPEIDRCHASKYHNYISLSIYMCAILHAVQDFHSWGWRTQ